MFPFTVQEKKKCYQLEFLCQLAAKNASHGNPHTSADRRGREWMTKMDRDVEMCKTQRGRRRKLGKWIRRMDQTGKRGDECQQEGGKEER